MANLLGRIFGSGDTTEKVVDGVISGVDALFFTEEEKSAANMRALELKIEWAKATTGSRLARRVLAFMFTGVFLLLVLIATGLGLMDMDAKSDFVFKVAKDTLSTPVAVIIGFYFAVQLMRN